MNNLIDNFFYWHPLEDLDALLDVMTRINDEEHLRMIFDASNLLEFPEKTDQDAYWKTWLDAAGKYIEAMHIKDFYLDNDRNYCPCPLGEGVMNYTEISNWIHSTKPDMYLLREEMDPMKAAADIQYMRAL